MKSRARQAVIERSFVPDEEACVHAFVILLNLKKADHAISDVKALTRSKALATVGQAVVGRVTEKTEK